MTVKGLGGLKAKMAKLPGVIEARGREAMEAGADEIVAMMKRLVPVDDGDLRDSIGWAWGDPPEGAITVAKSKAVAGNQRLTIFAGNKAAYYSRWIEFGTVKMAAKPFFFPSYRALRKRTRDRIMRSTRKALKEVAAMPDSQ